jgi:hypothetical protein
MAAVEGELPIDDDCGSRWFLLCGQYSIQKTRIQFEHLSIEKDNGASSSESVKALVTSEIPCDVVAEC